MKKVSVALGPEDVADVVTALRLAADAAEALSRVGPLASRASDGDAAVATLSRRYRKLARRLAVSAGRKEPSDQKATKQPPESRREWRVASEESANERARLQRLLEQKRGALINLGVFPGQNPVRERLKDGLRIGIAELEELLRTPGRS